MYYNSAVGFYNSRIQGRLILYSLLYSHFIQLCIQRITWFVLSVLFLYQSSYCQLCVTLFSNCISFYTYLLLYRLKPLRNSYNLILTQLLMVTVSSKFFYIYIKDAATNARSITLMRVCTCVNVFIYNTYYFTHTPTHTTFRSFISYTTCFITHLV